MTKIHFLLKNVKDSGRVNINEFRRVLVERHKNVFTTIVACTDDDASMQYLDNWDKNIPRLDVIDDFRSERTQITRAQGSRFRFSFGDYICKSMVGSINPDLDKLDEVRQGNRHQGGECCAII